MFYWFLNLRLHNGQVIARKMIAVNIFYSTASN